MGPEYFKPSQAKGADVEYGAPSMGGSPHSPQKAAQPGRAHTVCCHAATQNSVTHWQQHNHMSGKATALSQVVQGATMGADYFKEKPKRQKAEPQEPEYRAPPSQAGTPSRPKSARSPAVVRQA
jgi:hypothetical protein